MMTVTAQSRSAVRSRPELDAHFAQYELVVVDDACTDDTVARLREWGAASRTAPLTIPCTSLFMGLRTP